MSRKASGLQAWIIQRITATYIGLFALYLLFALMFAAPQGYVEWHAWFAHPLMNTATLLAVVAILLHAWIGVRDVLIDYIKPPAVRIGLLALLGFVLLAYGLWSIRILIGH